MANSDTVKVGITNRSGVDRLKEINEGVGDKFSVVWEFPSDGVSCLEVERNTHTILREMGYKNPTNIFDGRTECFVGAPLPLVYDIVTKQFERVKNR